MPEIIPKSKAKIFLAEERGCDETDRYRNYSTLNFGKYFCKHKKAFANLYAFNDSTLAGGHNKNIIIEKSSLFLLLPVVGAVSYKDSSKNENMINAGQLHVSDLPAGSSIEVSNSFKNELINFLEIFIETEMPPINRKLQGYGFDLNENKNKLIGLSIGADVTGELQHPLISLGKFAGRKEAVYQLKNKQNKLFVFVIQGVFEVQGRLLHTRDGLGLWDVSEDIELEALSNEAIVLLIELK